MLLGDIPDGASCYIDATILYYHIVNSGSISDECSDLLERLLKKHITGITSSANLSEAIHKVMIAEIVGVHGLDRKGLVMKLKRNPSLLSGLKEHTKVLATARGIGLHVQPVTTDILERATEVSSQHCLLTNDAITIAVMENFAITSLATNDDDFDTLAGYRIFKPSRL